VSSVASACVAAAPPSPRVAARCAVVDYPSSRSVNAFAEGLFEFVYGGEEEAAAFEETKERLKRLYEHWEEAVELNGP